MFVLCYWVEIRRFSITRLKPRLRGTFLGCIIVEIRRFSITRLKPAIEWHTHFSPAQLKLEDSRLRDWNCNSDNSPSAIRRVEIRRFSITRLKLREFHSAHLFYHVEIRRFSITRLKLLPSCWKLSHFPVEIRRFSITRLKLHWSEGCVYPWFFGWN